MLAEAGKSPSTLIRRKAALNKFGEYVGIGKLLTEASYRLPPSDPPNPHPLPTGMQGVVSLLDHTRSKDEYMLIYLCGMMGLRVDEAVNAKWADVDLTQRSLRVRGKGQKLRHIPITGDVLANAMFEAEDRNHHIIQFANSTARRRITNVGIRAGIKVASHDLRATFATDIYSRTKDIRVVQLLLGHASVTTTQRYIGIDTDRMRSAMPQPNHQPKKTHSCEKAFIAS